MTDVIWACLRDFISFYAEQTGCRMKPLVKGQETGLVEIPGSWYIDDLPPMMFIKNSANSHGWVNPR